jgi:hypothetical protein
MIRWRSSTQLTYGGEEFADLFKATAQWSRISHIPVDVTSAQEAADMIDGRLWYDLDVTITLQTGGPRELLELAAFLSTTLEPAWRCGVDRDGLRCTFDLRRRLPALESTGRSSA